MVALTGGTFQMDSDEGFENEKPKTSNRSYNYDQSGRDAHPVNGVDWCDARAYCTFVEQRLPTEAEWEYAASWKDGRKYRYPSGKSSISCKDAVLNDSGQWNDVSQLGCGWGGTWPVVSRGAEINGTYDMAGNVWEWTADWYGKYSNAPQKNPTGASWDTRRIFRGGGWNNRYLDWFTTTRCGVYVPSDRGNFLGFRCAKGAR